MLGKLLKHEFMATGRTLGIFYIALILAALMLRLNIFFLNITDHHTSLPLGIMTALLGMFYAAAIAGVLVLTMLIIIQRFYKNLLQAEGYLMHTLPLKPWQHITGKLIPAFVWCIVSIAAITFSAFISADVAVSSGFRVLFSNVFWYEVDTSAVILIVEAVILILVQIVCSILHVYLSMAIGQLANSHRILCSFGAYIGISMILNVFTSVFMFVDSTGYSTANDIVHGVTLGLGVLIILSIIEAAAFYFLTNYLLKKHLNLE